MASLAVTILLTLGPFRVATAADPLRVVVDGYRIEGFNPFGTRRVKRLLAAHTGTFDDLDTIRDAAERLESALKEAGFGLVEVIVPPQSVRNTIITLEVVSFDVAEIAVTGNRNFSDDNIRRSLFHFQVGETPNTKQLDRALSLANKHPSKRINVNFVSEGADDTRLNATIRVTDQKPWQVFTWANNTGTKETGEYRLGVGYQHGNLVNRDHVSTLTYTTAPDEPEKVDQYGLNYRIPAYRLGALLDIVYSKSDIDSGRVADVFDVAGRGEVYGAAFTYFLGKRGSYNHDFMVSAFDKLFDNDVQFSGTQIGVNVRSRPLGLRYRGDWSPGRWNFGHQLTVAANLSGGDFNGAEDYAATRVGADNDWWVTRYSLSAATSRGEWRFVARLNGQYADQPLIPGEQFGVGGLNSVSGFDQREVTGDRGNWLSLRAFTPPKHGFRGLGFIDAARVHRIEALPGEIARETLVSTGLGARWSSPKDRVNLLLDVGYVVDGIDDDSPDSESSRDGDVHAHFNLLLRY